MRRLYLRLLLGLSLTLLTACEGGTVTTSRDIGAGSLDAAGDTDPGPADADSRPGDDNPGGADADRPDGNSGGDTGETEGDVTACPIDRICSEQCCETGEECVEGQCLPPCGGDRCGAMLEQCCTGQQVCLREQCITPGKDCEHNLECPDGKICAPTLSKCVPDSGVACEYRPGSQIFEPSVAAAWKDGPNTPAKQYNQVMMTPAVVDMDESGTPDIVFSTFTGGNYNAASVLRAIDGKTYKPLFDLTDAKRRVSGSASLALGDIDVDGRNEIVAVQPGAKGIFAIDDHTTNWKVMWRSPNFSMSWDGASLVDLDGDGTVEVVAANRVFDAKSGKQLCVGQGLKATPRNSTAVDLDGDGVREIVGANGAFRFQKAANGGAKCPTYWTYEDGANAYPAAGDFGTFGTGGGAKDFGTPDGKPEIAAVDPGSSEEMRLYNGQTGELIWSAALPTKGHPHFSASRCSKSGAGPPTVADFDGDGAPEAATAGACYYAVFDTDGSLLWKHPSQDFSSRQTGSSVFDFQGDGKAEVVYADECFLRVYDGAGNGDGTTDVQFKRSHSSGTTRELPVIVDVDADFHAEIVMISNDYSGAGRRCSKNWPKFDKLGGEERGIFVVEDKKDRWVATRRVWNQHAYHVTNVCDGVDDKLCPGRTGADNKPGAIPVGQKANWKESYLNNFRQNVQGEGLFDAPDLVVTDISLGGASCAGEPSVEIIAKVSNIGARGVPAGARVKLVALDAGMPTPLKELSTSRLLLPGQSERLSFRWTVPEKRQSGSVKLRATADADKSFNECNEGNNAKTVDFQQLGGLAPDLVVDSISVDAADCSTSGTLTATVVLRNDGKRAVPGGVPVLVEADMGGQIREIGRFKTPKALMAGQTTSRKLTWQVDTRFVGQMFDVRATVDPDAMVFNCPETEQKTKGTECRLGG